MDGRTLGVKEREKIDVVKVGWFPTGLMLCGKLVRGSIMHQLAGSSG
jgi:hypothetical protein